LSLAAFAVGTDSFVVAGVLPDLAASLHVSPSVAGQLITAYALAYAVLSPVMAAVTGHWPRRTVLLIGLVVFILGTAGCAVLPSFGALLACRAIAGLGGAIIVPTAGGVGVGLVPAEQRGKALAVVLAGLTAATALGSPLGTALAAISNWRFTMTGVAAIGVIAAIGVATLLPAVPTPPAMGLRTRLAPLGDRKVALALTTTLLAYSGLFSVYSYVAVVLAHVTRGSGKTLAVLLLAWGISATVGNLSAGQLSDRYGSRVIAVAALCIAAADFAALPWTARTMPSACVALVVWGLAGWGLLVAQQHRLVSMAPQAAPVVIALNSSAVYISVSASGVIGAVVIAALGATWLGLVGAGFLLAGLVVTLATRPTAASAAAAPAVGDSVPAGDAARSSAAG
jgi:predicted MFS family arabinose efflux permease